MRVTRFNNSVAECGELLRTGEVDGILMDQPIMAYYRMTTEWCQTASLSISPPLADPLIGLIFAEGSPLTSRVNAELLDFIGTADYAALVASWFPTASDDFLGTFQLQMMVPAFSLLGIFAILQIGKIMFACRKPPPSLVDESPRKESQITYAPEAVTPSAGTTTYAS